MRLSLFRITNFFNLAHICRKSTGSTVFALSSGHGKCGVAVIRVSGPLCSDAVRNICKINELPLARQAVLKRLFNPTSNEMIDKAIVLWFPEPHSFTGEDCAEFHVHGGPAVISAMFEALGSLPGFRPAEPGEFSKKAFINNKLDLTEIEGLGDLLNAETEAQRRQAVRQMEGDIGKIYAGWRDNILKCLALIEAFIDFGEDEHIEEGTVMEASRVIGNVCSEMKQHVKGKLRGERIRDGVRVTIVGEPNVGKSSLLNILCCRPAAIVSPVAGTTRDVVEISINLGGYPVLLSDTAGLRPTDDVVEREGVKRALDRARQADVVVLVLDALQCCDDWQSQDDWPQFIAKSITRLRVGVQMVGERSMQNRHGEQLTRSPASCVDPAGAVHRNPDLLGNSSLYQQPAQLRYQMHDSVHSQVPPEQFYAQSGHGLFLHNNTLTVSDESESVMIDNSTQFQGEWNGEDHRLIAVLNKRDLVSDRQILEMPSDSETSFSVCSLSCTSLDGVDNFVDLLSQHVRQLCGDPREDSQCLMQSRHHTHLSACAEHLTDYQDRMERVDIVLAAQSLRQAMHELGRITGTVSVEDILGVIFKHFCIGK